MLRVARLPSIVVLWALVLAMALIGISLAAPSVTRAASEGCDSINSDTLDGYRIGVTYSDLTFDAGDHIVMSAADPSDGGPTMLELKIDGVEVDTATYPGTVEHTFAAPAVEVDVFWRTFVGTTNANAYSTWDVSCTPATTPTTPMCDGQAATIYVDAADHIVGGPKNGQPYMGKLKGTSGNDVIVGTDGPDEVDGKAGIDRICTLGGNDVLEGDAGNDRLTGGAGADRFSGGKGSDTATDFNSAEGDRKNKAVESF